MRNKLIQYVSETYVSRFSSIKGIYMASTEGLFIVGGPTEKRDTLIISAQTASLCQVACQMAQSFGYKLQKHILTINAENVKFYLYNFCKFSILIECSRKYSKVHKRLLNEVSEILDNEESL